MEEQQAEQNEAAAVNVTEETSTLEPTQTTLNDQPIAKTLPGDEILFGTLSYFTIAVLATIVTKPNSEFCKFHAKQGGVLIVFDLLLLIVITIALMIIEPLAYLIFLVGILGMFGLHILGIVNAVQGKMYRLPIVYELSQKIDVTKFFTNQPVKENIGERAVHNMEALKLSGSAKGEASENQNLVDTNVQGQSNNTAQPMGQDMVDRAVAQTEAERKSESDGSI